MWEIYKNSRKIKIIKINKWTDRDLNPGPPPCQGDDLPSELPAHINKLYEIILKKRIKELSFLKNLIEKQNKNNSYIYYFIEYIAHCARKYHYI